MGIRNWSASDFVFFAVIYSTAGEPRSMVMRSDPGTIRGQGEEDIQEGTLCSF